MDDLIESYRSLRALLEHTVATWPNDVNDDIRAAITIYLCLHCRECGAVIPEELRRRGEQRCRWCGSEPRATIRRGLEGEGEGDEVPF